MGGSERIPQSMEYQPHLIDCEPALDKFSSWVCDSQERQNLTAKGPVADYTDQVS